MSALREEFTVEKGKKAELDQELHKANDELENIEGRFPEEVRELRAKIESAKQETQEYEKRTKGLQGELTTLKELTSPLNV